MTGRDFWSRRRAAVEAENLAEERHAEEAARAIEEKSLEELSDAELLAKFDLPDPDTLQQGDDFSAFLKDAVPNRLKKLALRRLWGSNPMLANLDGLVEYGEDYTDAATVVEHLATTYQVGKGMSAHIEKMMQEAGAEVDEVEPDEAEVLVTEVLPDEAEETALNAEPAEEPEAVLSLSETDQETGSEEADFFPRRRKMRYKIHDDKGGAA